MEELILACKIIGRHILLGLIIIWFIISKKINSKLRNFLAISVFIIAFVLLFQLEFSSIQIISIIVLQVIVCYFILFYDKKGRRINGKIGIKEIEKSGIANYFFCVGMIVIYMMIVSCSKSYSIDDMKKYAEKKLEEKYGEEFVIKDVFDIWRNGSFTIRAYPVNNPSLIFEGEYNVSVKYSQYEYDCYIETIIGSQYEERISEMLEEYVFDYYVNVNIAMQDLGEPITDTDITIEEYDELFNEFYSYYKHDPSFEFYLSEQILQKTDEEIYNMLKGITDQYDCSLGMYIVTEYDLNRIKRNFAEYEDINPELYRYLDGRYSILQDAGETKKGHFGFASSNGKWNRKEEEFYNTMKEIRNNELFD